MLQQTMRSVCSVLSKEGGAQHTCLPITPELLLKLRKVWQKDASRFDIIMLWAACTTCFFGFFWAGEITTPSARTFSLSDHLIKMAKLYHPCSFVVGEKMSTARYAMLSQKCTIVCKEKLVKCSWAIRKRSPGELFMKGSRSSGPSIHEVLAN